MGTLSHIYIYIYFLLRLKLSTFEVLLGNYCPFFFSHKIQFLVRSLLFSQKKLVCCCLHVLVFRTETPIRHQSPSFVGLYICFYLLNRKIISLHCCWLYIHMQNYFSCKNHPYFAKQTRSSSPRLDFDLWGNLQELRGIHPWFSGINFTFRNQAIRFLLPKLEIFSWFLNNAKEKQCHFSFLDFHQMPNRNFICQNAEIFDRIRGFDQLIKGNGSWQDLRLWRGRSFDRRLCERHFRVTCGCSDGWGAGTRCRWVTIDYHIYIYMYIYIHIHAILF